jgi:hypothetical protein
MLLAYWEAITMAKISNELYKLSTGWAALAGLVIFLLFTALVLPGQSQKAELVSQGAGSPDTSFIYSADDLYRMAKAYGEQGRQEYVRARFTFDLVFPLVYTFFLLTSVSWVLARAFPSASRWRLLNLLPLAGMLFDYLENIAASLVMLRYPAPAGIIGALASFFTPLKWILIAISFAVLVISLALVLIRWIRQGTQMKT